MKAPIISKPFIYLAKIHNTEETKYYLRFGYIGSLFYKVRDWYITIPWWK